MTEYEVVLGGGGERQRVKFLILVGYICDEQFIVLSQYIICSARVSDNIFKAVNLIVFVLFHLPKPFRDAGVEG